MPVAVTRTISITAIVVGVVAFSLMCGYLQESDFVAARSAGTCFGACIVIVLLTTMIRLVADIGEKLLLAAGYRYESTAKEKSPVTSSPLT